MKIPHSKKFPKKKSAGYSLTEVIISVFIISVVSVAAFYSYNRATQTLGFFGEYKKIITLVKTARSYAVTNRETIRTGTTEKILPERYGVHIKQISGGTRGNIQTRQWQVILFAEEKGVGTKLAFDNQDIVENSHTFDATKYRFDFCVISTIDCDAFGRSSPYQKFSPITIFFDNQAEAVKVYSGTGNARSEVGDNMAILFKRIDMGTGISANEFKRYIVIFKVSGLPEEYQYPLPWH